MDWDLIAKLLDVADRTRDYPKLKTIHQRTLAELEKIDSTPVKEDKLDREQRRLV